MDARGNIFVTDTLNNRIRRISPDGQVSTVAGSGQAGSADGPADEAEFWYPTDIAVGPDGKLYVADWKNHRIRVVAVP